MTIKNGRQPIHILLVEDNPGDVRLTQEAFKEGNVPSILYVAEDGVKATDFLHCKGEYADAIRPDIILLDLNLPRKDGREVLAEIKADEELKQIPVVVISTSQADNDIMKTYKLHGNCYITKPVDLDSFIDMVKNIEKFWLDIVKLPPRSENKRR
ncbi:MAG: response regulator [Desulfobacterales bacterium]|nr:response regulator [Desulfobacterales bacterium]